MSDNKGIDLAEFVSQTLVGVIKAVQRAQQDTRGTGAIINPSKVKSDGRAQTENGRGVEDVHFDVAVTAAKETGGEGGVKVYFLALEGGEKESHSTANRVKFSISVCWPEAEHKNINE